MKACRNATTGAAYVILRDTVKIPPQPLGIYKLYFESYFGMIVPNYPPNDCYVPANGYSDLDSLTFTVDTISSQVTPVLADHTVFPNPSSGGQLLHVQSTMPIDYVSCYNSTGMLIYEQQYKQEYEARVPLQHYPAGIYQVVVQSGNDRRTHTVLRY